MKHIKTPLDPKMRLTARIFAAWHFSFVKCPRWPAQCIVKQLCRAGEAQYTCSAWTRPEARRGCQHAPTVCQQVCSSLPVYTLSPGGGGATGAAELTITAKTWELFPYSRTTPADLLWKEVRVHMCMGGGCARAEVKAFGNELKSSLPSSSYSEALPQSSTVSPACSSYTKYQSHIPMPEALPTVERQGLPRKQENSVCRHKAAHVHLLETWCGVAGGWKGFMVTGWKRFSAAEHTAL